MIPFAAIYDRIARRAMQPLAPLFSTTGHDTASEQFRSWLASRLARDSAPPVQCWFTDYRIDRVKKEGDPRILAPERTDLYDSFCRDFFETSVVAAFHRRYPVWADVVSERCNHAVATAREFLQRLNSDFSRIAEMSGSSRIRSIRLGVGDTHRKGRSTVAVEFARGATVYYKPRASETDLCWNRIVAALRPHCPLVPLTTLDRTQYSWAVAIADDADERFPLQFRRGFLTGVAAQLGFTDLHYENVSGAGIVDTETILQPGLDATLQQTGAQIFFQTGLLGASGISAHENLSDSGGLDGAPPRFVLGHHIQWKHLNTNAMSARSSWVSERDKHSQAPLREALTREFHDGLTLALSPDVRTAISREVLQSCGMSIRYVHRSTVYYGSILSTLSEPGMFENSERRASELMKVCSSRYEDAAEFQRAIGRSEVEQLLRGDIPLFEMRADGREVFSDLGEPVGIFPGISPRARHDLLSDRFAAMSPADWSRSLAECATPQQSYRKSHGTLHPPSTEQVLAMAGSAFSSLDARLRAGWGPTLGCIAGIYEGSSGMAVALARAVQCGLLSAASQPLLERLLLEDAERATGEARAGAMFGMSSVALAYAVCARSLGNDAYYMCAAQLLQRTELSKREWDFCNGLAGYLYAAAAIPKAFRTPEIDARVKAATSALLDSLVPMPGDTAAWRDSYGQFGLAGFAHGNSGALVALARLGAEGDVAVEAAMARAERFEESCYDPSSNAYLDLRFSQRARESLTFHAWCHGAPGISLARLARNRVANGTESLRATLATEQCVGDSLCCGLAGLLEVMGILKLNIGDSAQDPASDWMSTALASDWNTSADRYGLFPGTIGLAYAAAGYAFPHALRHSALLLN